MVDDENDVHDVDGTIHVLIGGLYGFMVIVFLEISSNGTQNQSRLGCVCVCCCFVCGDGWFRLEFCEKKKKIRAKPKKAARSHVLPCLSLSPLEFNGLPKSKTHSYSIIVVTSKAGFNLSPISTHASCIA